MERFHRGAPEPQAILDLFAGRWVSTLPDGMGLRTEPGGFRGFEDDRIRWVEEVFGPLSGQSVLELGPLEGGHTAMLHGFGASVTAIEANRDAFLRCLAIKETFDLQRARFLLGDFMSFLDTDTRRFDLVVASGVLYHMTDPLALLHRIVARTDRIFLWTHHLPELPPGSDDPQGTPPSELAKPYHDPDRNPRFSGGTAPYSVWLSRATILTFFEREGFDVRIAFDHADHPNGPAFAICAQRRTADGSPSPA